MSADIRRGDFSIEEVRDQIADLLYPTYGQEDRNRSLAIANAAMVIVEPLLAGCTCNRPKYWFLFCAGCDAMWDSSTIPHTGMINEARAAAARHVGWQYRNGRDFCPECSQEEEEAA